MNKVTTLYSPANAKKVEVWELFCLHLALREQATFISLEGLPGSKHKNKITYCKKTFKYN